MKKKGMFARHPVARIISDSNTFSRPRPRRELAHISLVMLELLQQGVARLPGDRHLRAGQDRALVVHGSVHDLGHVGDEGVVGGDAPAPARWKVSAPSGLLRDEKE